MKFKKDPRLGDKYWDNQYRCFKYQGPGWSMHEGGFIEIYGHGLYNNPYNRESLSKALGVVVANVFDVCDYIYLDDGTSVKPGWFKENFPVLLDKEHRAAIPFWDVGTEIKNHYRQSIVTYPSEHARPTSYNSFRVFKPDRKLANQKERDLAPTIGEAKLRAGILGLSPCHHRSALDILLQDCSKIDLTNNEHVRLLLSSEVKEAIRWSAREYIEAKELRYEP